MTAFRQKKVFHDTVRALGGRGLFVLMPLNGAKNDKPTDTLMARDEARHGRAFEGLLKRYFGK